MYLANLPCILTSLTAEDPSIPIPRGMAGVSISSQSESFFSQFPGEGRMRVTISCESGFE
jgi:hypothetical protein